MEKQRVLRIISEKFETILSTEASRGIHDGILLKILFKHQIRLNGLLLGIPLEEFNGSIEDAYKKCKIIDNKKYNSVIDSIKTIIIELFQKMNYKIIINYGGYKENIIVRKLSDKITEKIININFIIPEIEIYPNNISQNDDMFILKESLSNRYFAGENSDYVWDYKKIRAKIYKDLDEMAISIISHNFTDLKLIKYTVDDIEEAFNEETDKEMENIINLNPNDIEWFNSIEYSHWMNMAHISAQNDWLTSKARGFLMQMGKYKQEKREPSYKQIRWLKKICDEYNTLNK